MTLSYWLEDCVHAPKGFAKHCKATNADKPGFKEPKQDPKKVNLPKRSRRRGYCGKGFYGCVKNCPLYKSKLGAKK